MVSHLVSYCFQHGAFQVILLVSPFYSKYPGQNDGSSMFLDPSFLRPLDRLAHCAVRSVQMLSRALQREFHGNTRHYPTTGASARSAQCWRRSELRSRVLRREFSSHTRHYPTPPPLCTILEEERALAVAARRFARDRVAPLAQRMDEEQRMDPALIDQLFEAGLMGLEIPEAYGGCGASFTSACLVIEQLAKVDPAVSARTLGREAGACAHSESGGCARARRARPRPIFISFSHQPTQRTECSTLTTEASQHHPNWSR